MSISSVTPVAAKVPLCGGLSMKRLSLLEFGLIEATSKDCAKRANDNDCHDASRWSMMSRLDAGVGIGVQPTLR